MKQRSMESSKRLNTVLTYVFLILGALIMVFPFVWMILTSLKTVPESMEVPPTIFPKELIVSNFGEAIKSLPFAKLYWNTGLMIVFRVICAVLFSSMAGYAFAKIRFKGGTFLFFLILMAMMIPYQVTQVPLYILFVNKFKMTNTFAALILPGCVTSYNIFLSKQFFSGIPTSLIENAKVEGATQFRIFRSIILPLSKTVLAVMAINTFMGSWNTFFWPFLVTSLDSMYTIQVGLKTFKFANGTLLSPMMAGAAISALPMFVLFFSLQKYFLEGVTIGAVKG